MIVSFTLFMIWFILLILGILFYIHVAKVDNGSFDKKEFFVMISIVILWFFLLGFWAGFIVPVSYWWAMVAAISGTLGIKLTQDILKK